MRWRGILFLSTVSGKDRSFPDTPGLLTSTPLPDPVGHQNRSDSDFEEKVDYSSEQYYLYSIAG